MRIHDKKVITPRRLRNAKERSGKTYENISGTILSQVLIEFGITGSIGAVIATLLAAGGVTISSRIFSENNLTLNMQPIVVVSLLVGPLLLAIFTAILVAWNAVRVRPLMVLGYE